MNMKSGNIVAEGGTLYYRTIGEGKPIIFLHGGPGTPHGYLVDYFFTLSDNYQLIFFDQRGAGLSEYDYKKPLELNHLLIDINKIQEEFKLDKFHLIGHSFGGALAAFYASKYSKKLLSLTVISPAPGNVSFDEEINELSKSRMDEGDIEKIQKIMANDPIKNKDIDAIVELINLQSKSVFCNPTLIRKPLFLTFEDYMKAQLISQALEKQLNDFNLYPKLNKVNCKTLIIHGEYDTIPLSASQEYNKEIKNSQFVIFEKSGHYPFVEENEKFIKLVRDFLSSD